MHKAKTTLNVDSLKRVKLDTYWQVSYAIYLFAFKIQCVSFSETSETFGLKKHHISLISRRLLVFEGEILFRVSQKYDKDPNSEHITVNQKSSKEKMKKVSEIRTDRHQQMDMINLYSYQKIGNKGKHHLSNYKNSGFI